MFAAATDHDTLADVIRREAHRHAARLAAIARERDDAAPPILDRAAQRQITARRLASREGMVSGK